MTIAHRRTKQLVGIASTALGVAMMLQTSPSSARDITTPVSPWSGTVTVQWREVRDCLVGSDGCPYIDTGTLEFDVTGGEQRTFGTDSSGHTGNVTGSGNTVGEQDGEVCRSNWSIDQQPFDYFLIATKKPAMQFKFVEVTTTSTGTNCSGVDGVAIVGNLPYDSIDYNSQGLTTVQDVDPDPDVLRGTTVFEGSPNGDGLKEYRFAVSYDLSRGSPRYIATVSWPAAKPKPKFFEVRISKPDQPRKFRAWRSVDDGLSYTFRNLKLGKYVVQVRAVSKSGKKGNALSKSFTVTPAFRTSD